MTAAAAGLAGRTSPTTAHGGLPAPAPTADELATIADSAAVALGGPTLITDERFDVVAYSRSGDDPGSVRSRAILDRRLPRDFLEWLRTSGLAQRIRASARPVAFSPPGTGPHLVAAIRLGDEVLGHVWLALTGDGRPDPTAATVLGDTAARAAGAVLRRRLGASVTVTDDALGRALAGVDDAGALALRIDPVAGAVRLIALDLRQPPALSATELRLVETIVALCVEGPGLGLVTMSGTRGYALVRDHGREAAWELALTVTARVEQGTNIEARAVITDPVGRPSPLPELRSRADRCLDAPSASPDARVRHLEDARSDEVLDQLTEVFARRPELLHRGLLALVANDGAKQSDHVRTLSVYLESNCDLGVASRVLFVHRNTLKYRLGRIGEIAGIDLARPAERLLVELQLRFLAASAPTAQTEHRLVRAVGASA